MDPITTVGGALTSLNAAIDLARAAVGAKVDAEVRAKVAESMNALIQSQTQLLDARMQLHDLVDENRRLKRELEDREEWKLRMGRYDLVQAPGGAMVFRFKEQSLHYACPACFEGKRVQVLQDRQTMSGNWVCPGCGKDFRVGPVRSSPSHGSGGGSWMAS